MVAPLCKLSLVCPREIKSVIADALDEIEAGHAGFTVVDAAGHGPNAALATAGERVQGAMKAAMFILILPRAEVERVLSGIAERCQRRQLAFWTEPVDDYGHLT
jgi:nitrogen regulatory protein PII